MNHKTAEMFFMNADVDEFMAPGKSVLCSCSTRHCHASSWR